MNPSKEVKEFVNRHSVNIVDSNKRAYRHTMSNVQMFRFDDDYNKFINDRITFETETLYTVEIAESELDRIANFEAQVFNNMAQTGHYNLFETLMKQKQEEKRLRDNYPAVKKAYEQYSLMLKLAESNKY